MQSVDVGLPRRQEGVAAGACRSPGVAHGAQDGGDHPQRPVLLEQIGIDQVLRHALAIGGILEVLVPGHRPGHVVPPRDPR
jgi:hypothetical protein